MWNRAVPPGVTSAMSLIGNLGGAEHDPEKRAPNRLFSNNNGRRA
jgi:hypothetical protein